MTGAPDALVLAAFALATAAVVAYLTAAARARRAERALRSLGEMLPAAVFQVRTGTDGRRRYQFIAASAREVRGIDPASVLGDADTVLANIVEEDRGAYLAALERGERTLAPIEVDYRVHAPGGALRWVRTTAVPRREAGGDIVWSGQWTDVTAGKQLLHELNEARAAAAEANRAKGTFLATMSHEVRTPMNGILGMLELVSLSKLQPEQRTTLEVVRESSKALLRLIDDILDFSRIEAGRLEIRPEPASVADVVGRVRSMYSGNASSKGLRLEHYVDARISPSLLFDPQRLQQILANLTSNAVKFTRQGEVRLAAELVERGDGFEVVRVMVADTGVGIAEHRRERLFEPFSQVGEAHAGDRGTGLGLSICQRLAALMGATIAQQGREGQGTTMVVTLRLPLATAAPVRDRAPAAAAPPAPAPERVGRVPAGDGNRRILVVDDHPVNRMVLQRQVEALGYAAETAQDGADGLARWSAGRFDAVITDCNMPQMDGYQLARRIRAREASEGRPRTPLIACTANALPGESVKCFEAGMDDYLAKPVELARLEAKLAQWVPAQAGGA